MGIDTTLAYEFGGWYRICHNLKGKNRVQGADDTGKKPRRHKMALRVERNIVWRYQGKRDDVSVLHDFHAAKDDVDDYYAEDRGRNRYRSIRLERYAREAGVTNASVLKHFSLISINDYVE